MPVSLLQFFNYGLFFFQLSSGDGGNEFFFAKITTNHRLHISSQQQSQISAMPNVEDVGYFSMGVEHQDKQI